MKNLLILLLLGFVSLQTQAAPGPDEWEALAKQGDTKAMISLGLLHHTGDGVPTNYHKAMDWYLQAYEKKNGDAFNNIGVLFRDGLGVPKNEKVAYLLFLTVHMEGLGDAGTQVRAGRNLGRLQDSLKEAELHEALSYTWEYVDQIVKSRGQNTGIGNGVLPAINRVRIRDNGWWSASERARMTFKSPPPWDNSGTPAPAQTNTNSPAKKP